MLLNSDSSRSNSLTSLMTDLLAKPSGTIGNLLFPLPCFLALPFERLLSFSISSFSSWISFSLVYSRKIASPSSRTLPRMLWSHRSNPSSHCQQLFFKSVCPLCSTPGSSTLSMISIACNGYWDQAMLKPQLVGGGSTPMTQSSGLMLGCWSLTQVLPTRDVDVGRPKSSSNKVNNFENLQEMVQREFQII